VVLGILLAKKMPPAGFLNGADAPAAEQSINGFPVLGNLQHLAGTPAPRVVIAVGNNFSRAKVADQIRVIAPAAQFIELIHPTAILEAGTRTAPGVQICAGAILCADAQIAEGCLINTAASIDHECRIEKYCHISPGARLAGRVTVGEFTHVGIGAVVIEKIRIGARSIIGAGAVVIRDVPDDVVVVGNPARIIKRIESQQR